MAVQASKGWVSSRSARQWRASAWKDLVGASMSSRLCRPAEGVASLWETTSWPAASRSEWRPTSRSENGAG